MPADSVSDFSWQRKKRSISDSIWVSHPKDIISILMFWKLSDDQCLLKGSGGGGGGGSGSTGGEGGGS